MEIKVYKKCYLVKRNYMEYKVYNISDNKKILKIKGNFDGFINISISDKTDNGYYFKRISHFNDSVVLLNGERMQNNLYFSNKKSLLFKRTVKNDENLFYWIEKVEIDKDNEMTIGNIDEFEITEAGDLYCRGWISNSIHQVKNIYACFETLSNKENVQKVPLVQRRRSDVRDLFKNNEFLFSGFNFKCSISTTEDLALYISYYSESGVKKMFVKNICRNSDNLNSISFQEGKLKDSIEYEESTYIIPNKYWEFKKHKVEKLIFKHNLGGGAEIFIQKQIDLWRKKEEICALSYISESNQYRIELFTFEKKYTFFCVHLEWFMKEILVDLNEIWINELVSYPNVYNVLKWIDIISDAKKISVNIFIHDYFCVCPRIVLLNGRDEYCRLPDSEKCDNCLKETGSEETNSITLWRRHWKRVLQKCESIVCFSNDTKRLLNLVYKDKDIENKMIIKPHEITPLRKVKIKNDNMITIGLLGNLTEHKGLYKVLQLLNCIKDNNKNNVRIVLIGSCDYPIADDNFFVTGKYIVDDLPSKIEQYNVNVFFMSSICPETFSYTVSEMMELGLPIISYNLGAQGERVGRYNKGCVIPLETEISDVLKILLDKAKESRGYFD